MTIAKFHVVQASTVVQDDVVSALERALELAKSGNLQCIAISGVRADGYCYSRVSLSRSRFELLGAIDVTHNDLLRELAGEVDG